MSVAPQSSQEKQKDLPRRAAFDILRQVIIDGTLFDIAFEAVMSTSPNDQCERAFPYALCKAALRDYGRLTAALVALTDKKKPIKPKALEVLLVMAAAQIWCMDVPSYAAVSSAMDILKSDRHLKPMAGFANAILRKASSEESCALFDARALSENMPQWFFKALKSDYGAEKTGEILAAARQEPALDIVLKAPDRAEDYQTLWQGRYHAENLAPDLLRLSALGEPLPRPDQLEGFSEGDWWVQDCAAHLPVALTQNTIPGGLEGLEVLDLCAAPGGKTMQLAASGATVTAFDLSEKRLERLRQNLQRTQLSDRVTIARGNILDLDASIANKEIKPLDEYDLIILDAPCSATGTLRRHLDVLIGKTRAQIEELVKLQRDMLGLIAARMKQDRFLLYCTCSLLRVEGEKQIQNFMNAQPDFEKVPFENESIDIKQSLDKNRFFRSCVAPHNGEIIMDGFFAALLRKQ
jgi:16S rRNA (cytosine967-C5)-methyltransferase